MSRTLEYCRNSLSIQPFIPAKENVPPSRRMRAMRRLAVREVTPNYHNLALIEGGGVEVGTLLFYAETH
jgi:hypothetical protein